HRGRRARGGDRSAVDILSRGADSAAVVGEHGGQLAAVPARVRGDAAALPPRHPALRRARRQPPGAGRAAVWAAHAVALPRDIRGVARALAGLWRPRHPPRQRLVAAGAAQARRSGERQWRRARRQRQNCAARGAQAQAHRDHAAHHGRCRAGGVPGPAEELAGPPPQPGPPPRACCRRQRRHPREHALPARARARLAHPPAGHQQRLPRRLPLGRPQPLVARRRPPTPALALGPRHICKLRVCRRHICI
ncbi:hypothetical protein H4R21_002092, partial [Coemansia helicoidea]